MSETIDEKLARISRRRAAQAAAFRDRISAADPGLLALADLARERFQAKLEYYRDGQGAVGTRVESVPWTDYQPRYAVDGDSGICARPSRRKPQQRRA